MQRREPWMPPLLTVVTCGIYYFYWQYVTTEELKHASGREELNPMMDLLITILCCGVYGIYVQYRNAQIVHETIRATGNHHDDKSMLIVILHAIAAFNGATGLVAMLMLQDDFNKLYEIDSAGGGGTFGGPPPPQTF